MRKLISFSILLAWLALEPLAAGVAPPPDPLPRFALSADRSVYWVGEPVELTFTLTNETGADIKGHFNMGFRLNNLKVWYGKENQPPALFISSLVRRAAAVDFMSVPRVLKHGESVTETESLLYSVDPPRLVLPEPGVYEFRAKFWYRTGAGETVVLESNVVRVTAASPPEAEKKAFQTWNDPELLDFIQGNDGFAAEAAVRAGMKKADGFVNDHGGSLYAKAARKGLTDYLTPRANTKKLTPEEEAIHERLKLAP